MSIVKVCEQLKHHPARPDRLRASLQRDVNGLIELLKNPDTANPRRDVRRSIQLASRELQAGCDPALATELHTAQP